MKKIIIFVLAVAFACSIITVSAGENTIALEAQKEINILMDLGIISRNITQKSLTRGEVSDILMKLSVYSPEQIAGYSNSEYFDDVSPNHKYAGSINMISELKYMNPKNKIYFGVEESAKYSDVLVGLVKILGYELEAQVKGGYPTGYVLSLKSNQVSINNNITIDSEINASDIAKTIYSALTADLLQRTSFSSSIRMDKIKGENILTKNLKIGKVIGIVAGNRDVQLFGETQNLYKNELLLNNTVYNCDVMGVDNFIGFNVEAYYKIDNRSEIKQVISITKINNTEIEVDAEDIKQGTNTSNLIYQTAEQQKEKRLSIGKEAKFIYNGRVNFATRDADLTPANGSVKLIDNNQDGIYDVIVIYNYQTYVVKSYDNLETTIFCKYSDPLIKITDDVGNFRFFRNGKEMSYEGVKENDVLLVGKSKDGILTTVHLSSKSASGTLAEKGSDNSVTIKQKTYKFSTAFKGNINLLKMGFEYKFLLDADDKIVDAQSLIGDLRYGYLIAAERTTGLNTEIKVKIFASSGEFKIYTLKNKIKINDDINYVVNQSNVALNYLKQKSRLIRYRTNTEDFIINLYTSDCTEQLTATYPQGIRTYENSLAIFGYRPISGNDSTPFFVDADVIMFSIPSNLTLERNFKILSMTQLQNDKNYDVHGYNGKDYKPEALVITEQMGSGQIFDMINSKVAIVMGISQGIGKDGETIDIINVLKNGKTEKFSCDSYTEYAKMNLASRASEEAITLSSIQRGDLIYNISDTSRMTSKITKVLPYITGNDISAQTPFQYNATYSSEKTYGRVKGFFGTLLVLDVGGKTLFEKIMGTMKIYLYDVEKDKIQVSTTDDIIGENINEQNPVWAFVSSTNGLLNDIVIFKFVVN